MRPRPGWRGPSTLASVTAGPSLPLFRPRRLASYSTAPTYNSCDSVDITDTPSSHTTTQLLNHNSHITFNTATPGEASTSTLILISQYQLVPHSSHQPSATSHQPSPPPAVTATCSPSHQPPDTSHQPPYQSDTDLFV